MRITVVCIPTRIADNYKICLIHYINYEKSSYVLFIRELPSVSRFTFQVSFAQSYSPFQTYRYIANLANRKFSKNIRFPNFQSKLAFNRKFKYRQISAKSPRILSLLLSITINLHTNTSSLQFSFSHPFRKTMMIQSKN